MNRRGIMFMLVGAIASLSGFATIALLRQRRCEALAGRWDQAVRQCRSPDGVPLDAASGSDVLAGVVVGLILAFMLFRLLMLVMGRMSQRSA